MFLSSKCSNIILPAKDIGMSKPPDSQNRFQFIEASGNILSTQKRNVVFYVIRLFNLKFIQQYQRATSSDSKKEENSGIDFLSLLLFHSFLEVED